MRRALYDPERGYYSRRIPGVGKRGDFTTAPMLSETPAKAIAAWAAQAMRETGCRDLIEIGPGEGKLAASVMNCLPWHARWKSRLHLVETSAPLAELQQKLLGGKARWHSSPIDALAACDGKAVIFSNELVDAFPVRRFQKTPDGWRELAVEFEPGGLIRESLLPSAPLPDSSSFSQNHPLGQCIEVHDSYRRWLGEWLPHWKAGRMLTIDYGAEADTLYQRRPHGTVRAYLLQQRLEGPDIYHNIGRQDLTADVNFTDLVEWSAPWTAEPTLKTLAKFIGNTTDRFLTDKTGAGGAFSSSTRNAALQTASAREMQCSCVSMTASMPMRCSGPARTAREFAASFASDGRRRAATMPLHSPATMPLHSPATPATDKKTVASGETTAVKNPGI